MSNYQSPVNPYLPPPEIVAERAERRRPGGLTVVCVLVIILGVGGILTGLVQVAALVGAKQFQQQMNAMNQGQMNAEQAKIQKEMEAEVDVVASQFFVVNVVQVVVHFVVAIGLVVGGINTFRLQPMGRTVLLYICMLALLYEAGRTVVTTMVQLKTMAIMEVYFPKLIAAGPQGPGAAQAQEVMKVAMKVGMIFGMVIGLIFVLAKVVLYSVTLYCLNRDNVKPLFAVPILAT